MSEIRSLKDCLLTCHRYQPKSLLFSGGGDDVLEEVLGTTSYKRFGHFVGQADIYVLPVRPLRSPKCPNVMRPRCNFSNCRRLDTLWIHCDKNNKNDTQIQNTQIHKHTIKQIHKCLNVMTPLTAAHWTHWGPLPGITSMKYATVHKYTNTQLCKYTLEKYTNLLVIAVRKYITFRGPQTLCNGPETRHSGNLKVWPTDQPTDLPTHRGRFWRCLRI